MIIMFDPLCQYFLIRRQRACTHARTHTIAVASQPNTHMWICFNLCWHYKVTGPDSSFTCYDCIMRPAAVVTAYNAVADV